MDKPSNIQKSNKNLNIQQLGTPGSTTADSQYTNDQGSQGPIKVPSLRRSLRGEYSQSSESAESAVIASGTETVDTSILIQEYNRLDEKIDTFFFERVDGMFEYLLFLILYKYLGIFGPYKSKTNDSSTIVSTGNNSSDDSTYMDDRPQTPMTTENNVSSVDSSPQKSPQESPIGNITVYESDAASSVGGAPSENPCSGNFENTEMKNIQIIKLYKELNHDFKNLNDMSAIREFCLEFVEENTKTEPQEEYLNNLYKSIKNGNSDEWNFYTSILEYFSEGCDGFNDLSMIRYKSCTNKETEEKEYIIRDINSYPSGETSYSNLFVVDDFRYRYQDNGTNDEVLSKLVQIEEGVDFKSSIQVIKNAPSLIDPATVHPINMSKFYPRDAEIFEFQKCQDLNNETDTNNATIVQGIIKRGIEQFFSYFGAEGINVDSVRFVVFQDNKEIDPLKNELYNSWLTNLKNNNQEFSGKNCPFYYTGIRISVDSLKRKADTLIPEFVGGAGPTKLDLHVGDISIPNITNLINSGYYKDSSISTYTDANDVQTILDPETKKSWNRVVDFAKYIMDKSNSNFKKDNDFLRFIIISLKSFGDSFQVYYSTAIQRTNNFFPEISKKTYLSSSDKNTGAEKMLYASPFLLNGCGIHPYQGLQERFPAFFKDELSGDEMVDRGDIGSKHGTQYKMGSSKAILTNIKSGGKDYKRYVQVLSNQIVGIVDKVSLEQKGEMIKIIEEMTMNYDAIQQWSINPPLEDAENVSKLLHVIYNKLKIFQETNNELDDKINVFLDDFENQEEYLTKLIDVNRSPTTEELQTLIDNLDKDPNEGGLESDLIGLISKATNVRPEDINNNIPISSPGSIMMIKIRKFIENVKDSVRAKKIKLTQFIKKLEVEKPSRPSRRPYGMSGLMEMLTSKVIKYTARGGRNKTIKNRKIYMKKYTRKAGFRPNKRKTRNNMHQTKDRRKTIKK